MAHQEEENNTRSLKGSSGALEVCVICLTQITQGCAFTHSGVIYWEMIFLVLAGGSFELFWRPVNENKTVCWLQVSLSHGQLH